MRTRLITQLLAIFILMFLVLSCGNTPRVAPDYRVQRFLVEVKVQDEVFDENTYLVYDNNSKDGIIVDPGNISPELESLIQEKNIKVRAVLNTHGHPDHIGANNFYKEEYGTKVYAHILDKVFYEYDPVNAPTKYLRKEKPLSFGSIRVEILHTPGHSAGSLCLLIGRYLLTGDTLFKDSVGRTWSDNTRSAEENQVIQINNISNKLLSLPDTTPVLPGHGEQTTIGQEILTNPFLTDI